MPNLPEILAHKPQEIALLESMYSLPDRLVLSHRDFKQALLETRTSFILECKKASPSKGLICADFNLARIIKVYNQFATCISVLTDMAHFKGSYENLRFVSGRTSKPVLCKDFIITPFQVKLARYMGADAILLMLSALEDQAYQELATLAHSLNMAVLCEVSDAKQVQRALELGAQIIGINNRDLHTLKVDLNTTHTLRALIPEGHVVVSESGFSTHAQIKALASRVHGFLVGSALMSQPDLHQACVQLIYGAHKLCGLTRLKDSKRAYKAHFLYGGLIFDPISPRYISPQKALKLVRKTPGLKFVGVFVEAHTSVIVHTAQLLGLSAVQLYGDYSALQISLLKTLLDCAIWQVHSVDPQARALKTPTVNGADLILYDSKGAKAGGNGVSFAWELLGAQKQPFMLAGGIGAHNLKVALGVGALGLDINSGAERSPGKKSKLKILELSQMLREY
ncbi:bifunctional indole-3-glycerol-phosphate synthase TrpC/phosphoribosylanthranilate isomerase TrpF [Helicobacter labacensis]|uniref:bifunctional indole-3-glycerol-phosphate synthase TrpC/phosphoribosylanthranilate isomerase TrpF n=1 Tax=Helicobacter labacensis TaxID=2316079 RepID=UPI000EAF6D29|nr:bifunctional indole-3-glycerol-phosphate synthase TrpC/phosphoribosylanthranilate isomerase TrpF [Helicobacter labacensis]